jgi:D-alanine-D-alanine ligase
MPQPRALPYPQGASVEPAKRGIGLTFPAIDAGAPAVALQSIVARLMARARLAVIFAGKANRQQTVLHETFNTRPWKSYEAVAQDIQGALRRLGFRHVALIAEDIDLPSRLRREGVQMAWLNTAGVQGHNPASHAAAMLEMIGVPYVGHDPLVATMLDNKHLFKRELCAVGIATPPFMTWNMAQGPFEAASNARFKRAFPAYNGPFVVKPAVGRASLNVHVVDDAARLPSVIEEVFAASKTTVLVEEYMPGREYVVAVSGAITARGRRLFAGDGPFVFGAQERVLAKGERVFTSMDVAPITEDRVCPIDRDADGAVRAELHALAGAIYREFGLSSLVRLDVRADANGAIHVLEANPKPDLKQPTGKVTSLICAGLAEQAMDYDDLVLTLIADRVHTLLSRQRGMYPHFAELLS